MRAVTLIWRGGRWWAPGQGAAGGCPGTARLGGRDWVMAIKGHLRDLAEADPPPAPAVPAGEEITGA